MNDPPRFVCFLVRPRDALSDEVQGFLRKWRKLDWRACTCIHCGEDFNDEVTTVFVVIDSDDVDGAMVAGFCSECLSKDDTELLRAVGLPDFPVVVE